MKSPFILATVRSGLADSPLAVIDVGARGGVIAPWDHKEAGSLIRHFGFEPNPTDFQNLKPTATAKFFKLAISDAPGTAKFYAASGVGSLAERSDRAYEGEAFEPIEVQVETLENMVNRGEILPPDVIKTDAELYDLSALRGTGRYLDGVLCIVSEFEYYRSTRVDNSFSSIDKLLTSHGMLLFGLSQKSGPMGEIGGGDLMYMRDVGSIIGGDAPQETKRAQLLKLFAVCGLMKQPKYAEIVCATGRKAGLLSEDEAKELRSFIRESIFLPWAMPGGAERLRARLTHMLSLLGEVITGGNHGVKSAPRSNQFRLYNHAFINSRWLPASFRRRYDERLKVVVEAHESLEGIYFQPIAGTPRASDGSQK